MVFETFSVRVYQKGGRDFSPHPKPPVISPITTTHKVVGSDPLPIMSGPGVASRFLIMKAPTHRIQLLCREHALTSWGARSCRLPTHMNPWKFRLPTPPLHGLTEKHQNRARRARHAPHAARRARRAPRTPRAAHATRRTPRAAHATRRAPRAGALPRRKRWNAPNPTIVQRARPDKLGCAIM